MLRLDYRTRVEKRALRAVLIGEDGSEEMTTGILLVVDNRQ